MPNRNEKEASKVSLDETSNFNFANLKLGQFSMREERERKRCGGQFENWVDATTSHGRSPLKKRERGRRLGWEGKFHRREGTKDGKNGGSGNLVARWTALNEGRGMDGWMDGKKTRKREEFLLEGSRRPSREWEREREESSTFRSPRKRRLAKC